MMALQARAAITSLSILKILLYFIGTNNFQGIISAVVYHSSKQIQTSVKSVLVYIGQQGVEPGIAVELDLEMGLVLVDELILGEAVAGAKVQLVLDQLEQRVGLLDLLVLLPLKHIDGLLVEVVLGHEEAPDGEHRQRAAPDPRLEALLDGPALDEGVQGQEGPDGGAPLQGLDGEGVSEHVLGLQVVQPVLFLFPRAHRSPQLLHSGCEQKISDLLPRSQFQSSSALKLPQLMEQ